MDILSLSLTGTLQSEQWPCFTNEEQAQRARISPKATLLANYGTKIQNECVDSEAGILFSTPSSGHEDSTCHSLQHRMPAVCAKESAG